MHHARFVVPVGLLHEAQIPLEPIFTLPFLDLDLHARQVAAELEALAVAEPDVVVWLAFQELNAFGGDGGVEVAEDFFEEAGEEEEGGALVEALPRFGYISEGFQNWMSGGVVTHITLMVDQGASSAGEIVLLEYGYSEASFR